MANLKTILCFRLGIGLLDLDRHSLIFLSKKLNQDPQLISTPIVRIGMLY